MDALQKILDASIELFTHYGFKTITMDDIARHAGISKKTLYQFFANKEEVVLESISHFKKGMGDNCQTVMNEAENAVEAMVRVIAFFDEMHKHINPLALFELQRFFPEAYRKFRLMLEERDVAMLKTNIMQGIEEGLYRPDVDADLMARFRLETSLLIFQPNLMVNERTKLITVALEIGEHFMYGIMTAKGEAHYCTYKSKYLQKTHTT